MKGTRLQLSKWQADMLKPYFNEINFSYSNDNPIGLFAQIYEGDEDQIGFLDIRIVDGEACKKIQEAVGSTVGKIANEIVTILAPDD